MTASNIQDQDGNIVPPRWGFVIAQTCDATSRGYDLTALVFQDESVSVSKGQTGNQIWLDLEAIGADVYFAFDSAAVGTNSINEATVNAAGAAWTGFTANAPGHIASGTVRPVRIDRAVDKTLILKGAGATLRISQSSQSLPGATPGS